METATVHEITDRIEQIHIDVLIPVPIAATIQNMKRDVSLLAYLRSLKLAHPISTDEMLDISLLIGADAYKKLVQNDIVRWGGPTEIQSKLGYMEL